MESKRVVHVIDDEETIRKAVGFTLRTAGFAVETYGSGVDFLKIADEAERGSIVLDMHMPDMNGLQVQAALTQMDISMPVVMLTGNGDIALAVQAMKAGAVDFLAKPIERPLLLDAIDRAFARIDTAEGRALEEAEACRQVDLLTPRERDVLEGLRKAFRTRPSPMIWAFLHGRSKSIARASCPSLESVPLPKPCGSPLRLEWEGRCR